MQQVLCEQLYYYGFKDAETADFDALQANVCIFNPKNSNIG